MFHIVQPPTHGSAHTSLMRPTRRSVAPTTLYASAAESLRKAAISVSNPYATRIRKAAECATLPFDDSPPILRWQLLFTDSTEASDR